CAALPVPQCAAGDGRTDLAQSRLGDPQRRRSVLHRPRCEAADARMGNHGRRGGALHLDRALVARGLSGARLDARCGLLQPSWARVARYSRPADAHMSEPLLSVEDLHVTFSTRRGPVEAVRGVSLSLQVGEMLGLVGESGSGKSVTGFAVTRLLD